MNNKFKRMEVFVLSDENVSKFITNTRKEIENSLNQHLFTNDVDNLILGWDTNQLDDIGLPKPPKGFVYVIGAYYKEWFIKKCLSHHIYLIPRENYLGEFKEQCYDKQVKIYKKSEKVRQWQAGFSYLSEYVINHTKQIKKKVISDEILNSTIDILNKDKTSTEHLSNENIYASLETAFSLYKDSCDCGDSFGNDCAHYLSNALIKAGFRMGPGEKCRCGRMKRAKELLDWVRSLPRVEFGENHNSIRSGYWFVYQEDSNGQGHVCLHEEYPDYYYWVGTGNYEDWPVQWHYKF